MHPITHGLAPYALRRSSSPRASRATLAGAVLAGTAADLDQLSVYLGPSAFLAWHRTFTHSVATAILLAAILAIAVVLIRKQKQDTIKTILPLFLIASLLHRALHLCH